MLPLGATLNMDGLALSRVVVTIFVAQLNDIYLSPGRIVVVWWVFGTVIRVKISESEVSNYLRTKLYLRTFAPIATAHLQCARYSLVTHVPRHFQARARSPKLNKI